MREKSAHSPRQDSNLYLWNTHPSRFRLHHEGRPHLASVKANTSDTHPPAPSWNNHAMEHSNSYQPNRDVRQLQGPLLSRTEACQRKAKDRADGMREKVHISLDRITCTSGIRAHRASDYTTSVCVWERESVCVCLCVCVCVCVTMKKSVRRMASTTSDTGDTSSNQQQAHRKENYNKSKRPGSSVDHCHPYIRKKRREAVY